MLSMIIQVVVDHLVALVLVLRSIWLSIPPEEIKVRVVRQVIFRMTWVSRGTMEASASEQIILLSIEDLEVVEGVEVDIMGEGRVLTEVREDLVIASQVYVQELNIRQ